MFKQLGPTCCQAYTKWASTGFQLTLSSRCKIGFQVLFTWYYTEAWAKWRLAFFNLQRIQHRSWMNDSCVEVTKIWSCQVSELLLVIRVVRGPETHAYIVYWIILTEWMLYLSQHIFVIWLCFFIKKKHSSGSGEGGRKVHISASTQQPSKHRM